MQGFDIIRDQRNAVVIISKLSGYEFKEVILWLFDL